MSNELVFFVPVPKHTVSSAPLQPFNTLYMDTSTWINDIVRMINLAERCEFSAIVRQLYMSANSN